MLILGIAPGSENKINTRIWKVQAQIVKYPQGSRLLRVKTYPR